jgi:hypothetical protein
MIDVVAVQPVVIVEAVIVVKPATISPPEAAVRGVLVKTFGSGVIVEADTTFVYTGTSAVDADTPAVDMIGHAADVFTTEATHVFTAEATDVFAAEPADMATAHAADMTAAEAATTHVTAAEASAASDVATTTAATAATRLGGCCQQAAGQHSRRGHHHQSFHHDISFFVKENVRHAAVSTGKACGNRTFQQVGSGDCARAQPLNSL